jgi:hypothetical protein
MFLFDNRKSKEVRVVTIRDEWGQMHDAEVGTTQHPRLSDQELADALGVGLITVLTHRRD